MLNYATYYPTQLGDAVRTAQIVQASAGAISSIATAIPASALATFGSAASAVPVVGWIAAAVAFIASALVNLFKSQKVAKQLYASKDQVDQAIKVITDANQEADKALAQLEPTYYTIKKKLGLYVPSDANLGELGASWFDRTFYASNTAKNALEISLAKYKADFPRLERELMSKISKIQKIQFELPQLQQRFEQLVAKNSNQSTVMSSRPSATSQAGGMGLGILALLVAGGMFIRQNFKST